MSFSLILLAAGNSKRLSSKIPKPFIKIANKTLLEYSLIKFGKIRQIKKIISSASSEVDGVIVDVDKTGCSGYAYKLDYAKNTDSSKYEVIEKDGIKIFIEPKATMFLIGS